MAAYEPGLELCNLTALSSSLDTKSTRENAIGRNDPQAIVQEISPRFGTVALFKQWFPGVDPGNDTSRGLSNRTTSLIIHQLISTAILLLNIALAISSIHGYRTTRYTGQFFQGNCDSVKTFNRWLHLGINAASTILLGSSNYCAQILAAPTRTEVDRAHAAGKWLDIGIQSFRNLRRIEKRRSITWMLLMASSACLHLIWNSAIFSAIPVSRYSVALVTNDFAADHRPWEEATPNLRTMRANISELDRLNKTKCIERYINIQAGVRDLLVVSANVSMADRQSRMLDNSSSVLALITTAHKTKWNIANIWICSAWANLGTRIPKAWCRMEFLEQEVDNWVWKDMVFNDQGELERARWYKIDYCLSDGRRNETMDHKCALRFNSIILVLVCILNLTKCICIGYTSHLHHRSKHLGDNFRSSRSQPGTTKMKTCKVEQKSRYQSLKEWWTGIRVPEEVDYTRDSLVTIGDAISNFLQHEDMHTNDMDLMGKFNFTSKWPCVEHPLEVNKPKAYSWWRAVSLRRWCFTYLVTLIYGAIGGTSNRYGTGTFNGYAYVVPQVIENLSQAEGFFFATFLANSFQLILSGLYLLHNSLITTMLVTYEWNGYVTKRKTLRLSCPRGIQRSSYSISLPLRYGLPLSIGSGVLHWLISQSIFVVSSISFITPDFHYVPEDNATIIGFSAIGLVLSLTVGGLMFSAPLALGILKSNRGPRKPGRGMGDAGESAASLYPMPLASTCSAAISAACHRHEKDVDAHLLPVIWGFVQDDTSDPVGGRFCFTTANDVKWPF